MACFLLLVLKPDEQIFEQRRRRERRIKDPYHMHVQIIFSLQLLSFCEESVVSVV